MRFPFFCVSLLFSCHVVAANTHTIFQIINTTPYRFQITIATCHMFNNDLGNHPTSKSSEYFYACNPGVPERDPPRIDIYDPVKQSFMPEPFHRDHAEIFDKSELNIEVPDNYSAGTDGKHHVLQNEVVFVALEPDAKSPMKTILCHLENMDFMQHYYYIYPKRSSLFSGEDFYADSYHKDNQKFMIVLSSVGADTVDCLQKKEIIYSEN